MIADLQPYPEYKESGLPWLGRVPRHWDVRRMKSAVKNVIEQKLEMTSDEVYVALEHVESWTGKARPQSGSKLFTGQVKRFRRNDVLFGKLRPYLAKVSRIASDGVCAGEFFVLRPADGTVSSAYLEHLLRGKHMIDVINGSTFGAKMPRADWQFCGNLPIPLPPPEEQAAIVRYLGYVDGRIGRYIRAKEKLIKLLEEQKQAIIHHAVTRGLDPNAPLKPSGIEWLGDIPAHWEVRRLRSISPRIGVGLVINPSSYFVDEGYPDSVPMLLGNNIVPNGFRLSKVRYIGVDDNQRLPASRLAAGDVVVVRVGAPGVAAVVPENLDGCNCASVMIVRKHNSFESQWLAHAFNSPVVARQIDVVKYGAAQKQFNIGHAVSFLLPVPPVKEQRAIVEAIRADCVPVNTAIGHSRREIALLREYRTRLIADVVTGKVDVRAAAALPDAPEDLEPLADPALALEDEEAPVDPEMEEVEA